MRQHPYRIYYLLTIYLGSLAVFLVVLYLIVGLVLFLRKYAYHVPDPSDRPETQRLAGGSEEGSDPEWADHM